MGRAKEPTEHTEVPLEFNPPADAPAAKLGKQLPCKKRRGGERRRKRFANNQPRGGEGKGGERRLKGEWEKTDG